MHVQLNGVPVTRHEFKRELIRVRQHQNDLGLMKALNEAQELLSALDVPEGAFRFKRAPQTGFDPWNEGLGIFERTE